jgi:hypothetical protein
MREADDLIITFEDEPFVGATEPIDARSHLVNGRDVDFPTDRRVLDAGAVNRHARSGIPCRRRTHTTAACFHAIIFQPVGSGAVRGHARRRHIVARWLMDFRDLMLTLDKTLTAIRLGQTYS